MYKNNNENYQQVGYKGLERLDITVRVIECIDLMGDLFTSLRFEDINPQSNEIWKQFINSFFKIFHMTAAMLDKENLDLITNIETSFTESLFLSAETSNRFLSHFEDYLHAMRKAGIYDPSVIRKYVDPSTAWEGSI